MTGRTAGQSQFPIAASGFDFKQHGQSGHWMSSAVPHLSSMADDMCMIKTMHTEAINHDPAITYIQTGSQLPGRPSAGAWVSYGLGSMNANLPAFVVLHSTVNGGFGGQALYARLWGAGFLSTRHQGVSLRSNGDPVLYLSNPDGMSESMRRRMLDELAKLNHQRYQDVGDPEIQARIAQYEMAFRMQASVPELTDLKSEPEHVFDLYGKDSKKPGKYAYNCILARRMLERGVPFVQLFHRGWDQHGNLYAGHTKNAAEVDKPIAGFLQDLKSRGLLEDTLVIWGGEFGRTPTAQGASGRRATPLAAQSAAAR